MGHEPRFIRPTAPVAERAIIVGDPGRALLLAQDLIASPPPMFNHHRGLWGYCGPSKEDGDPLLIQGTGLGAASLNAVVTDLIGLGVRRFIRVGSCRALGSAPLGATVIADRAIGSDGVSVALGIGDAGKASDPDLLSRLIAALGAAASVGLVASSELGHAIYSGDTPNPQVMVEGCGDEVLALDMCTAALYATAAHHGARAASVLVAARRGCDDVDDARFEDAVRGAGTAAAIALGKI